jgi:peptide/nickel transport system substrate-binding protein
VVNDFLSKQVFPENVFTVLGKRYETLEGALARYRALQSWLKSYDLAVVSNGPYILSDFDPAGQYAELRAYRDQTYPFKPGKWYFGTVERPRLQRIEGVVTIGADTRITLSTIGAGEVAVSYILRDPVTGAVLDSGSGKAAGGVYTIKLPAEKTSRLTPGYLELTAVVYSEDVAQANTVTQRVEVRREAPVTETRTAQTTPTTTPVQEGQQPPLGLIIAVVGVAVVAAATALILRRRKPAATTG